MNLPNKLTIARCFAIIFIIIIALIRPLQNVVIFKDVNLQDLLILIIFALASFTDYLDGKIARKYNLITNFGKFMDPLADKLLVMTTMICLLELGKFTAFGVSFGFVIIIILAREFAVTGLRVLAADNNVVIAASKLGKAKTVSQMVLIILLIINCQPIALIGGYTRDIVTVIFTTIAFILTIVSGIDYFIKNEQVFKEHHEESDSSNNE